MEERIIADKQSLDDLYQYLADKIETRPIKVAITTMKGKTKEQLGYYWSTIVPRITKELNERGLASAMLTQADVNEVLNKKFFSKKIIVDGEIQTFPRSKASADVDEMKIFIMNVINWATNLGIHIPPPLADDII
jgi:DNA-directed RNA polymerase beta' subunit